MCKCCEEIEFWKKHQLDTSRFKEKFFAKISVYTWKKEQRAAKGKEISIITSKAYNLKYCPECGKRIKRYFENKSKENPH